MWHHSVPSWRHVTSQIYVMMKELWNIRHGRCMNAQAFSLSLRSSYKKIFNFANHQAWAWGQSVLLQDEDNDFLTYEDKDEDSALQLFTKTRMYTVITISNMSGAVTWVRVFPEITRGRWKFYRSSRRREKLNAGGYPMHPAYKGMSACCTMHIRNRIFALPDFLLMYIWYLTQEPT